MRSDCIDNCPKEVGYYWVRYKDTEGAEPFIVKVNEDKYGKLYADPMIRIYLKDFPVIWLSGKLKPPDKEPVCPKCGSDKYYKHCAWFCPDCYYDSDK